MKPILFLLAFVLPLSAARMIKRLPLLSNTYYISSTGSDANDGLSPATPWKTPKGFSPGHTYLFKCGDVFYTKLPRLNTTSTNRVTISKYGAGTPPTFSSFATIKSTAWSLYATNVWVATITSGANVTGQIPSSSNVGFLVINGVKNGYRAGQLAGLNFQWEFYCDFNGGHLYVYSTSNPSLLATWIMAATDVRPITGSQYMTIDGIRIEGCASAPLHIVQPINDTIRHCRLRWLGGEMKSIFDSTRQGAGVEFYNGGINSMMYYDTVEHTYECALSYQSHASGPTPGPYINCVVRKCYTDSCESSWNPTVAPDSARGFIGCRVDSNTFTLDGWSWSHFVKPEDNQAVTLLNNFANQLYAESDIIIEHNIFMCPREGLYFYSNTNAPADPRFITRNNDIYMDSGILIRKNFHNKPTPYTYTLVDHAAFTADQGYEVGSTWHGCSLIIDTTGTRTILYRDADGDSYGNISDTISVVTGTTVTGYVSDNTDCNDLDATIHPHAPEVLDGIDNDCNGIVDDCVKKRFHGQ